jgi:predicted amidophosphoribosyltransferase
VPTALRVGAARQACGVGIFLLLDGLVDLVLPRRCAGCEQPGWPWCAGCRPAGSPFDVRGVVPGAGGLVAGAVYAEAVRSAVLAYKERGRRDLAGPLGELLASAVLAARAPLASRDPPGRLVAERLVLVPVPSGRAVRAARGGDHVLRLARRAAPRCAVPVAAGALSLTRMPQDSAGLGIAERAANLAGAMRAAPPPKSLAAVLVDDVVTTGASLREAAPALAAAGWPIAGAATVAATPRRVG